MTRTVNIYKGNIFLAHFVFFTMNNSVVGLVFLVLIQFLSFSCALYVLIHCIKIKSILRSLPNHLIICLLIIST